MNFLVTISLESLWKLVCAVKLSFVQIIPIRTPMLIRLHFVLNLNNDLMIQPSDFKRNGLLDSQINPLHPQCHKTDCSSKRVALFYVHFCKLTRGTTPPLEKCLQFFLSKYVDLCRIRDRVQQAVIHLTVSTLLLTASATCVLTNQTRKFLFLFDKTDGFKPALVRFQNCFFAVSQKICLLKPTILRSCPCTVTNVYTLFVRPTGTFPRSKWCAISALTDRQNIAKTCFW